MNDSGELGGVSQRIRHGSSRMNCGRIAEELASKQAVLKGRNMTYHGVIRGKMIELDEPPALPDGQDVTIEILPFRPGDGIRASAGTWADAGPELDEWLKSMNDARQSGRSVAFP